MFRTALVVLQLFVAYHVMFGLGSLLNATGPRERPVPARGWRRQVGRERMGGCYQFAGAMLWSDLMRRLCRRPMQFGPRIVGLVWMAPFHFLLVLRSGYYLHFYTLKRREGLAPWWFLGQAEVRQHLPRRRVIGQWRI